MITVNHSIPSTSIYFDGLQNRCKEYEILFNSKNWNSNTMKDYIRENNSSFTNTIAGFKISIDNNS